MAIIINTATVINDSAELVNIANQTAFVGSGNSNLGAGAIGTYVFARSISTNDLINFGNTINGADLYPTSAVRSVYVEGFNQKEVTFVSGAALTGTWRCMGRYDHIATGGDKNNYLSIYGVTLWLRIS